MRYSIQLFWSVPSSAYKKCCKDLVKRFPSIMLSCPVICENDPTLRRGFLNPFLSSQDAILSSFRSVLTLLKGYSKHGVSPISHSPVSSVSSVSPVSPVSPSTFEYPIPSDLLRIFSLSLILSRRAPFLPPRQPFSLHFQRVFSASAPLRRLADPPPPSLALPAQARPQASSARDDTRNPPARHRDVGPRRRRRRDRALPARPGIAEPELRVAAARAAEGVDGERGGEETEVREAARRGSAEKRRKPAVRVDFGGTLPAESCAHADSEAEYLRGWDFCPAGRSFAGKMRGRAFIVRTRIARRTTSVLFVLLTRMMSFCCPVAISWCVGCASA